MAKNFDDLTKGDRVARASIFGKNNTLEKRSNVESEDGYLASKDNQRRYEQLQQQGVVDGMVGGGVEFTPSTTDPATTEPNRVNDDGGKLPRLASVKEAVSDIVEKVEDLQDQVYDFKNPKDERDRPLNDFMDYLRKGMATAKDIRHLKDAGLNNIKSILAAIDNNLPLNLPASCQAILDNFKALLPKHKPRKRMEIGNGAGDFSVLDNEYVQCALDALDALSGLKGIKDFVTKTVTDIEAEVRVIVGIMTTLMDYDIIPPSALDNVFKHYTEKNAPPGSRVYHISTLRIVEHNAGKGRPEFIEWAGSKIGWETVRAEYPTIHRDIISNYKWSPTYTDEQFNNLLDMIDIDWSNHHGIYYLSHFSSASQDAIRAFLQRDDYRSLAMLRDIIFIDTGYKVDRQLPSKVDVTRDLYPNAIVNNQIVTPILQT